LPEVPRWRNGPGLKDQELAGFAHFIKGVYSVFPGKPLRFRNSDRYQQLGYCESDIPDVDFSLFPVQSAGNVVELRDPILFGGNFSEVDG